MALDLYRLLSVSLLFWLLYITFFISAYCFILTLIEEVLLSKSDPLSSLWDHWKNDFHSEVDHQYK